MTAEELRTSLLSAPKNGYVNLTAEQRKEMEAYALRYRAFMDACKTEREATAWATDMAEKHGFVPAVPGMEVKPGDRIYFNNRGKSFMIAVIGKESLSKGANICAAHVDSPRMDLKPQPLYEDSEIAYFKTHYYGGIKKYQWTCVPLAIHGVICRKDGTTVAVTIGEDESDPIVMVSDLLIHLAADQMRKTASEVIAGEQLNVILGSEPLEGEGADLVKLNIMKLLNEKYGIVEDDFRSAELTIVPAGKSREVGLDRSLLAAYGHDDRVCAYPAVTSLLACGTPGYTAVTILADKEEIGSVGNTGMQSAFLRYFIDDLAAAFGAKGHHVLSRSICLSADVNAGFDPIYPDVLVRSNAAKLNYGVCITKYTGARGKSSTNDASAEYLGQIRSILDKAQVPWQIGEMGKVDAGGGGTVAMYIANLDVNTVDLGVPVLSMHAPYEVVSKIDVYAAHRAFLATMLR